MAKERFFCKRSALLIILLLITVIALVVSGTSAWLTSYQTKTNVFIGSDLAVDWQEPTGTTYAMVPGDKMAKNPSVTVYEGSEPCYLFMRPEESSALPDYVEYSVRDGWNRYGSVLVDGKLDDFYLKTQNLYFDSNNAEDYPGLNRYVSNSGDDTHVGVAGLQVRLWVAYDDNYVYLYAEYDTRNTNSRISFMYDPNPDRASDVTLEEACVDSSDSAVVFCTENDGSIYPINNSDFSRAPYNDSGYIYDSANIVTRNGGSLTWEDDYEGATINDSTYCTEVRLPRADDSSNSFLLNICAEEEPLTNNVAWSFGPYWWHEYNSMKRFTFNDADNPFFNPDTDANYYYRLVGDVDDGPLTADQTFYALRGQSGTDIYGNNMANGYVQFRNTILGGTEMTNETLKNVSTTLTFKTYAIQQATLPLHKAFALAKPHL